jgi:tetratricopeptide (TPR) repeat protein
MRWLVLPGLACLFGCADYRQKPIFPEAAAHRLVLNEQGVVGLSAAGEALVAQLVDADGQPPELELLVFDAHGGPSKSVLRARPELAKAVAAHLLQNGTVPLPLLALAVRGQWPQAAPEMLALGFHPEQPLEANPSRTWPVTGTTGTALVLREREVQGPPRSVVLTLSEGPSAEQSELARMPLYGEPVASQLYVKNGVVWLLSGSFKAGEPLHRAVGVRRGALGRGESVLHVRDGLADWSRGDLAAARRQFDRAIAADGSYVDALYQGARSAAATQDDAAAIALLRRAAAADPARVQVLGRSDPDLQRLREKDEVRMLLGERRAPPEGVPRPP